MISADVTGEVDVEVTACGRAVNSVIVLMFDDMSVTCVAVGGERDAVTANTHHSVCSKCEDLLPLAVTPRLD